MNVRIKDHDMRVRVLPEEIGTLLDGETLTMELPLGLAGEGALRFTVVCAGEHPYLGEVLECGLEGGDISIRIAPEALQMISEGEEEDSVSVGFTTEAGREVKLTLQRDLKPRHPR